MIVDGSGRTIFATDQAWQLVREYCPHLPDETLPGDLRQWVRRNPKSGETFKHSQSGDRLILRCGQPARWPGGPAGRRNGNGNRGRMVRLLRLEEEKGTSALKKLGLTVREAEVLHWIAQGKRNEDIAAILAISVGTVKKHCENLFIKLGVENRSSAVVAAIDALRIE